MRSADKFDVLVEPMYGKKWVRIVLKRGNDLVPSFEDLFRMIHPISDCEQEKYPAGEGRRFVAHFLLDAVYETDFEVLRRKYRIPEREK